MKLLTRTTVTYVSVTIAVFALGSWLFYSFLNDLVLEEATESLEMKKEMIIEILETDSVITETPLADDVKITASVPFKEYMSDTMMYDSLMGETLPFRVIHFPVEMNDDIFRVSIRKPLLESDDLQEGMISSFLIVLGVLIGILVLFIWIASGRIWKPFFTSLEQLNNFRPGAGKPVELPQTRVKEFNELNSAIEKMTSNTESSFQSLKSFSENAAHEIQTPLAVIQSTTEVLLQDDKLTEEQHKTISHLSSTTARLSNIVSTLLLLTRIENKQFQQEIPINFSEVVSGKMELFSELFEQRGIKLTVHINPDVYVKLHRVLAEILVSNLLVNAVKHTDAGGTATVMLSQSEFCVKNSGWPLKGDSSRIFERFYKEDQSDQSTGLGLSLVKMATDVAGLAIAYTYAEGNHSFSVRF